MRYAALTFVVALFALPLMAWALAPVSVEAQMNHVAMTGDQDAVQEEALRLAAVYPKLQASIMAYMNDVALPAAQVATVMQEMPAEMAAPSASDDVAALAAELNALDVGAIN